MERITKFTKAEAKRTVDLILDEVSTLSNRLGIKISQKKGSYNAEVFTVTFEIAVIREDGTVASKEATDYARYAEFLGITKPINSVIKIGGQQLMILGLNTRNRKYPIIVKNIVTNTKYKLAVSVVNEAPTVSLA